jgi:hypothetical protein
MFLRGSCVKDDHRLLQFEVVQRFESDEFNNILKKLGLTPQKAQHIHLLVMLVKGMITICCIILKKKLLGLSPRANYTDRATVACRRS